MRPNFVSRVQRSFKTRSKTKSPPSVYRHFLRVTVYVASGCLATFRVRSSTDYCVKSHYTDHLFKKLLKLSYKSPERDSISRFVNQSVSPSVRPCILPSVRPSVADYVEHATYGNRLSWLGNAMLEGVCVVHPPFDRSVCQ